MRWMAIDAIRNTSLVCSLFTNAKDKCRCVNMLTAANLYARRVHEVECYSFQ
uniref:Uncharacterized protein n=1 Tax=Arundo donax TaxID=35708 RepID=A0A0A8ZXZ0_ARUDO